MKNGINKIFLGLFALALVGCKLDYENTSAISPDNVWKNKTMISAFLSDINGGMMGGWPHGSTADADEGMNGVGSMGDLQRGTITSSNYTLGLGYGNIDKINFFLDKLENEVPAGILTDKEKTQMIGQAKFWRAWDYWGKVNEIGGVPLILKPQKVTDLESLYVERSSTSACIEQIYKDLDDAILALPDTWTGADYGRIDKCCAMAFKGIVAMNWASPRFNRNMDEARWEDAYKINKTAVEFIEGAGKGLYPVYEDIWYEERNEEVLMVNQFYYPDHTYFEGNIRPLWLTKDNTNHNLACTPLLLSYLKKDGSRLVLDKNRLANDPAYNAQFLSDFFNNRDDRFLTSVMCPGRLYPTPDMELTWGNKEWRFWSAVMEMNNSADFYGKTYASIMGEMTGVIDVSAVLSTYFQRKGLDQSLAAAKIYEAETDWIQIRFAEVLLNYAECANEYGKTDEAIAAVKRIRARAQVDPGTNGNYGIVAGSREEMRDLILNEKMAEFAFEGKRFNDVRRWMLYSKLNEMKYRSTLFCVLKPEYTLASQGKPHSVDKTKFSFTEDITDPSTQSKFKMVFYDRVDRNDDIYFNMSLKNWFRAVGKNDLDRNSKLLQNNEYPGGTFDPLK